MNNIMERHSFLSFSFRFFQVLSSSFRFFQVLSGSVSFCHFLSLFLVLLLSSGALNPFFLHRPPHDFLLKLLCEKSFFLGRLWEYTIGPSFFLLSIFMFSFSCFVFFFSISFHVFFFLFLFSILYSFIFLCFPLKMFLPFSFCFSFFFLGCSKSVAALQDFMAKRAHSELAVFTLYWLVVTFPCGIVHIL